MSIHAFGGNVSQYEITTDLLRNLYKFDLTPVTKLVLLELTTHLNESKNGSVVFPSVNYIAETIGIGLTACKKAINDLIKEGLIIKSKRDNVKGNYNKYLLRLAKIDFKTGKNENGYKYTPTDINGQKKTNKPSENELLKQSDSDLFYIGTNNNEKINNKEDEILKSYAIKHGAKNVNAYVNALRTNGSAEKIINERQKIEKKSVAMLSLAEKQIQKQREDAINSLPYTTSQAWLCLGKKFGKK
jgi:hypothetical protein